MPYSNTRVGSITKYNEPGIVTVVPSSVICESPTVELLVNLTTLLLVPDVVIDVPEEPFVPLLPLVPDEPLLPLEPELPLVPLVPEDPFVPLEPEVPDEPLVPLEPLVPDVIELNVVPLTVIPFVKLAEPDTVMLLPNTTLFPPEDVILLPSWT